jgi:hypothetical protein
MGFIAAAFGALSGAFGGAGLFSGTFGKLFGGLLKSFISKALSGALGGGQGGGGTQSQSRTLSVKQAITTKKIAYGRIKASGPVILFEAEGGKKNKEFLHIIVPVAAHEIDSFETVFLNQSPLILDGDGECIGSGPLVGTWNAGVLTLTDPNSAVLTEAEVDDKVKMKFGAQGGINFGTSTITGVETEGDNILSISETSLQPLNLEVGEEVKLEIDNSTIDSGAEVDSISGGSIHFDTKRRSFSDLEDLLIVGASVNVSRKATSGRDRTVTISAIDEDAGTITFTDPTAYEDGSVVWANKLDGKDLNGVRFEEHVRVKFHTGSPTQSADADAVEDVTGWTEEHKLSGIAYMYLRYKHDNKAFPNGLPNPSVVFNGKKVYDPRDATTAFSDNPALCLRDYLLDDKLGLGQEWTSADLDDDAFIAAANVCDETVTITAGTENRYACAGIVDTKNKPSRIIGELLSSMSGVLTQVGGKWKAYAGEYTAPTLELDENDVAGPIDVQTRLGRRELFNGVKGIYISEKNFWQESDYPAVNNATYVSADGGSEIWTDYNLNFTTSAAMAQRLAKIELLKVRQPLTVKATFKPKALQLEPNDSVMVTNSDLGWNQKIFVVDELRWSVVNDDQGAPYLGAELELRETASAIYDWDFSADEVLVDPAPNTGLNSIFEVTAPTLISADSGTEQLAVAGDGTVTTRVRLEWDPAGDQFVAVDGLIEIQKKQQGTTEWLPVGFFNGGETVARVNDVIDGVIYTFRARFINALGTNSSWSDELAHKIVGKSEPPGRVQNFLAVQNGALTSFWWDEVTDNDLRGYEIRYGPAGQAVWENGTQLVSKKAGNVDTSAIVPPGDHTFMIKAVDTSGNESLTSTKFSLSISNTYVIDTSLTLDEYAETAVNENLEIHHTNTLVPVTVEDATDDDTFDWSQLTPVGTGYHTLPEVDLGSDIKTRVWANITSILLPGITTGSAQPTFQLRYRAEGESFVATSLEDLNFLEAAGSVYTNCVLHHTGKLVPESQDLASVDGILDEFVQNAEDDWEYTSPEIDLGGDTSINLTIDADAILGPSETGTANYTVEIDLKADGGSYIGFASFTGGRINTRYLKFKLKSNSSTGKSTLSSVSLAVDDFQTWTVGDITARYVQARLVVDPDVGVMAIQDYTITLDTET